MSNNHEPFLLYVYPNQRWASTIWISNHVRIIYIILWYDTLLLLLLFYSVNEILYIVLKKSPEEKLEATCGISCSLSYNTSRQYKIKKVQFCKNYHLVNSSKLFLIISQKFFKCVIVWLVDEIATYSEYDFEVLLRELYEKVYRFICDSRHDFWKKKFPEKVLHINT